MKIKLLILIGLFICGKILSQDAISNLKNFYIQSDMDCYIDKTQKKLEDYYIASYKMYNIDSLVYPPLKIDLRKQKLIPMLSVQFKDTKQFNYGDNIYDYIIIDSLLVYQFACIDKKENVIAFTDFSYNLVKDRKLKHVIKNINKYNPDLILYSDAFSIIGRRSSGFMFIKSNKIYIYRFDEDDIYELNDYLMKFRGIDFIRSMDYLLVPINVAHYYDMEYTSYRAGHTPQNQIMICPPKK